MSDSFVYRDGILCAEEIPLDYLAAQCGTPFYCYSTSLLQSNYHQFSDAFKGTKAQIYYAVKSNPNIAVIKTLAALGAGADITSAGELERALTGGIKPEQIVYSGVGKKRDEILAALIANIHQFNVESIPEMQAMSAVAQEFGVSAPICIRVNPDIDPHTHAKIATGEKETKFGIELTQLDDALEIATSLPGLDFKGFAVHIGSQLKDFEPFRLAYKRLAELVKRYRSKGIQIERCDLGGGIGIAYAGDKNLASLTQYAAIVRNEIGGLNCEIGFEPGRALVGTAGVLVSRVVYAKKAVSKNFLILDAGMNDLLRPALYEARHDIVPVLEGQAPVPDHWDVVGPVCETSDFFGADYNLSLKSGDLVAIKQAGAYGAAMSSVYNGRPLIPEVLVNGGHYAVVRRRISVAEQIAWEGFCPWQSG